MKAIKEIVIVLASIPVLFLLLVSFPIWAAVAMLATGKSLKDFAREANAESGIA